MSPRRFPAVFLLAALAADAPAQTPAALSSRPGAGYTIYLNFGGFTFSGKWGASGTSAGFGDPDFVTPAYTLNTPLIPDDDAASIREIWARVAEKYAPFDVNVTTVDPAPAYTGTAAQIDAQRQTYYDSQPKLMHTLVGGNGSWIDPGTTTGGVSHLGVMAAAATGNGTHTNFVFANRTETSPTRLLAIGEASAHEVGHALGLYHHSVGSGATYEEYSEGTGATPFAGSRAPVMGVSYDTERGLWGLGQYNTRSPDSLNYTDHPVPYADQNDVAVLLGNPGFVIVSDGIGTTAATATDLPLTGTAVDSSSARGVIVPTAAANPSAITSGYFKFTVGTGGAAVNLTLTSGGSRLAAGTADPGATLDGSLELLSQSEMLLATANDPNTLNATLSANLPAGEYFVRAFGSDDTTYYNVGSYFLSGSITPVPEPMGLLLAAVVAVGVARRTRRIS